MKHKPIRKPRLPPEQQARRDASIIEDYKSGATMAEVGRKYNLTAARVCQILQTAEVATRGPEDYPKHGHTRNGKTTPEYRLYQSAKGRAKAQKLPFSLNLEDIKIPDVCPVFELPFYLEGGKAAPMSPSIDRFIPSHGYTKENISIICWRANVLKRDATREEMERLVCHLSKPIRHPTSDPPLDDPLSLPNWERNRRIANQYLSRESIRDLGLIYSLSSARIRGVLRELCVPLRPRTNTSWKEDLVGKIFGKLTVLERSGKRGTGRLWRCRCSCGNEISATTNLLKDATTTSCGCDKAPFRIVRGAYDPRYSMWTMSRYRSRHNGIPHNLRLEDIVIPKVCPALDIPIISNEGGKFPSANSPTLDRLIPEKGYVRGNTEVLSHRANTLKNNASAEELDRVAKWVRHRTRLRIVP